MGINFKHVRRLQPDCTGECHCCERVVSARRAVVEAFAEMESKTAFFPSGVHGIHHVVP